MIREVDYADVKSWKIIYPVYLNSKKSVAEGRRVSLSHAVDNPTCTEIIDMCKYLGFKCEVEADKAYSRDYTQKGRIRVQLIGENGEPVKADLKTKKQLLIKLGELIPKLQSRVAKTEPTATGGKKGKKK